MNGTSKTKTKYFQDLTVALGEVQLAYSQTMDEDRFKYYLALIGEQGIDPIIVQKAIRQLIKTSKFVPTISEILDTCKKIQDKLEGKSVITADDAWRQVKKAVVSYGYDRGLDHIQDPIARRVAQNIGWRELCYGDTDMDSTRRAHFLKAYKAHQEREKQDIELEHTISLSKMLNEKRQQFLQASKSERPEPIE